MMSKSFQMKLIDVLGYTEVEPKTCLINTKSIMKMNITTYNVSL